MPAADLLAHLNEPQRTAVTLPHTSALILAGAGSGKTRVLTTRIAWLLAHGHVSPQGILAVTFTNKAAREMLTRVSAMVSANTRAMWIGTFHGLCNRFLRLHWREARLPQHFAILDAQEQVSFVKRVLKAHHVDETRHPPKECAWFIASAKEEGLRPHEVEAHDEHTRQRVEIYRLYEAACQREGAVDFAELLLRTVEVLEQHEPLRQHYNARFRHLLIDEFQDTNALQYRWLRLMAGPECAVMAVGDDDQSIYAFRGAKVANMQSFTQDFAPVRLIRLEQNYRSQGTILDAANALIRHNKARLGKELWTDRGPGEPLRAFHGLTDNDEARFVVDRIQQALAEGTRPDHIAILYRSNAQSRLFEHALFNARIPYRVYGGLRFFERAEIKHALAYLRLISQPHDDHALLRVINFPPRGIGTRTIESLQAAARASGVSLWQVACSGSLAGRSGQALLGFVQLIERLRRAASALPLPELVQLLIEASGLRSHYEADRDGQDRLENLSELISAAESFMRESEDGAQDPSAEPTDPIAAFLAHAALEAGETQASDGRPALQLMTVHAAKGLEFDEVFITGLEEGLFPHENALQEGEAGLEEERRLMYVAITRARRRLHLSSAQLRMLNGQTRYNVASRFLEEIPASLIQWLSAPPRASHLGRDAFADWSSSAGASSSAPSAQRFQIGQQVRHARFGLGIIVKATGSGDQTEVEVNFYDYGLKRLALEYAKLTPA